MDFKSGSTNSAYYWILLFDIAVALSSLPNTKQVALFLFHMKGCHPGRSGETTNMFLSGVVPSGGLGTMQSPELKQSL